MLEDVEQRRSAAAEAEEAEGKREPATGRPSGASARSIAARCPNICLARRSSSISPTSAAPAATGFRGQARRGRLPERLDMIPARFKVIVTRRPKYTCRECDGEVAQAPAPRTSDRGRHSDRGADHAAVVIARIRGPFAALSALEAQDLWPPGRRTRPLDAGRLVGTRRLRATARLRAIVRHLEGLGQALRRRDAPRARCSILADGRPRPASCGPMPATTGPGAVPSRRASPMSTSPTTASTRRPAAHLAGFAGCLQVDGYESCLQSASRGQRGYAGFLLGARAAETSSTSRPRTRPRSPSRRWRGSAASTPSNAISGGSELRRGWPPAKPAPDRSSRR